MQSFNMNLGHAIAQTLANLNWILFVLICVFSISYYIFFSRKFRYNPSQVLYAKFIYFLTFNFFFSFAFLFYESACKTFEFSFRLLFPAYVLLLPIGLLGGLLGWLIAIFASKLSNKYLDEITFKLIHISLIVFTSIIVYFSIAKPFYYLFEKCKNESIECMQNEIITNQCNLKKYEPDSVMKLQKKNFIECIPILLKDSLQFVISDTNKISVKDAIQKQQSFFYKANNKQITDLKATFLTTNSGDVYLAILAIMNPESANSELLLFDKNGELVYKESFTDSFWILSKHKNYLMIGKQYYSDGKLNTIPQWYYSFD